MSVQHDARSIPTGSTLEPDVCVVGAGPAGITIALTLARAGAKVLLLDSGGQTEEADTQEFAKGVSVGNPYFPLHKTRVRGFGGTSLHWLTFGLFRAAPLAPLDFEKRPGVPHSGWPIDRTDLDPYYEQATTWCGLGPWDFSVKRWETADRQAFRPTGDSLDTVIFQIAEVDTWKKRFNEVVSTANLQLLLRAHVVEMRTDDDGGRIDGLRVRTTADSTFEVKPRITVLATGGIENARMLLLSRDRHPNGIGNANDLVGRFFQEHLSIRGGIIEPQSPGLADRMGLYFKHRNEDTRIHAKLTVSEKTLREQHLLNCAFFVTHISASRAQEGTRSFVTWRRAMTWQPKPPNLSLHAARVLTSLPSVGRTAIQELRGKRKPDTLQLLAEAEQAPNPDSRVTLSPSARDGLGQPRAVLDWRTTELDRRSIATSQDIIDQSLRASGIGRLERKVGEEQPAGMFSGHWHHMGTTRMHESPRHGVVDANCRVHDVANLFVAGSSVFPTSGYANPTFTIVALALRLADHLKSELRNGE
ncbi:GMC family oxidoreductase [soil metagenome]